MIVDDEAPARRRLRDLLSDVAALVPNEVVAEAPDGAEALNLIANAAPDVVLLDIRMPCLDGLELAQHLARIPAPPGVIFVTAFDQHAVTAFELNAVDYLLKPVRAPRLAEALQKLRRGGAAAEALKGLRPGGRTHLRSSERGRILLVPIDQVLFLKAELKYVTARTPDREYLLDESLHQLEAEYAGRFLRVHRNCLVARGALAGCERRPDEDGEARWSVLVNGVADRLPVSRRQWPQVRALLS